MTLDALEIAAKARCSIYDALYVAAADRWDTVVVTADRKLIERLAGSAWRDRACLMKEALA